MECDRLREVLFDHVDGLLGRDEAEAARDHLAACAPCGALQEEVRRNFSALDAWEEEELPAGAFERLEARIAASTDAPAARRSWARLAVPYGAGLATAAAFLWVFVLPHDSPLPAPAAGPSPGLVPAAPAAHEAPALPASPVAGGPSPRAGERPLEFRDVDQGVWRTFRLPPGVDPGKVLLVDTPQRILPDDDGVR